MFARAPFSIEEQLLRRNVKRIRGGLVFQVHRLVHHSTRGLRVIKKKKHLGEDAGVDALHQRHLALLAPQRPHSAQIRQSSSHIRQPSVTYKTVTRTHKTVNRIYKSHIRQSSTHIRQSHIRQLGHRGEDAGVDALHESHLALLAPERDQHPSQRPFPRHLLRAHI